MGEIDRTGGVHFGRGEVPQGDLAVPLDLADRDPRDVGHGDTAPTTVGRLGPGEHEEALGVATHPGGEVIEPEQLVEAARVGLGLFERGDVLELAIDQGLGAASEVDDELADGGGHDVLLAFRHLVGGLGNLGERAGEGTELVVALVVEIPGRLLEHDGRVGE